jgi:hypothetical protein
MCPTGPVPKTPGEDECHYRRADQNVATRCGYLTRSPTPRAGI